LGCGGVASKGARRLIARYFAQGIGFSKLFEDIVFVSLSPSVFLPRPALSLKGVLGLVLGATASMSRPPSSQSVEILCKWRHTHWQTMIDLDLDPRQVLRMQTDAGVAAIGSDSTARDDQDQSGRQSSAKLP
jgi:hypothetical protein